MFSWLRPLLAVNTRQGVPPTEPLLFRPSLECLGDRALPSAALGELAATAVEHGWPTPALVAPPHGIGTEVRDAGPGLHLGETGRGGHAGATAYPADESVTVPKGKARGLERIGDDDGGTAARMTSAPGIPTVLDRAAERARTEQPPAEVPRGHPAETQESDIRETAQVIRIEMRDLIPVDRVAAEVLDHLDHHFAAPNPEEAPTRADGPGSHARVLSPSAEDTPVPHLALASEHPGDARLISSPGRIDPAGWLRATAAVTSDRYSVQAADRPGPGAPIPSAAPAAPGDEQPAGSETAGGSDAVEFITQFLPFDTAGLRDEVSNFLRGLEPVILPVSGELVDVGWESIAAIVAGAGAALVVGKYGFVFRGRVFKRPSSGPRSGNTTPRGPTPVTLAAEQFE